MPSGYQYNDHKNMEILKAAAGFIAITQSSDAESTVG
jgi:hypothetical protein